MINFLFQLKYGMFQGTQVENNLFLFVSYNKTTTIVSMMYQFRLILYSMSLLNKYLNCHVSTVH